MEVKGRGGKVIISNKIFILMKNMNCQIRKFYYVKNNSDTIIRLNIRPNKRCISNSE